MLTTLHSFVGSDGETPVGALLQATDGNLYGTTSGGGASGSGTFYRVTTGGTLTTVYTFYDGPAEPLSAVIQATDGYFWGTTYAGGTGGTVFRITPAGDALFFGGPIGEGTNPWGALVQATDGNFYGTLSGGGASGYGTVFVGAVWTAIHSFNGADGASPRAGLIQASDGNFYGTTFSGGANNRGTVFQITSAGALTTLHSFTGIDGANPQASLIQATDGNFYGTTVSGGANSNGTVFELQAPATYTLTVSTNGDGTVTSTDGFINCPGSCQYTYNPGTQVTLNATPATGWVLSGWTGACIGTGSCTVTMTQNLAVTGVFIQPGPGQGFQFFPTTPCRLVDTRQSSPIQGGSSESFIVPQLGGCNIPGNAIAYSLNVTVVPHRSLNYLTIWPTGEAQPLVSLMNSSDARVKANAAIVPAGTNGAVSVYVTDTSDVILDIDGYFTAPGSGTLQFYPLTPCRVVDTRQTNWPQGLGWPAFGNMESRPLSVTNSPCLQGLPNQPLAYSFNVTVVPNPSGQPLNYLTIWPSDQQQPYVSTLNNPTATVVANAAIVPAAADGSVSVFTYNSTDVVLDLNGYFAAPASGGYSLYPVAPCRVLDTRGDGNGQPFGGTLSPPVNVPGSPCASALAQGYVFNATVVPSPTLGYLTLWPDSEGMPVVSTLNAYDGFITSNMAIVPDVNGSIDAYAQGTTQLILDIAGYFAP